ncbi:hypothetical protein ACH46_00490 [Gordonia phthalatica]|uniref:Transposase IS4-like domain-containing protein n=1 Tax=Gordonia phthalatica TaxID=1136941 RepID=A0A0N9MML1_9ACTN|nr:hypothetical protein ACH46_00490 [Gordonia phthalatica]
MVQPQHCGVTISLTIDCLRNAGHLTDWVQDHWGIENCLHWIRDVTFGEDASRVRTGNSPHVMASLRNIALSILRLRNITNIAAELRTRQRFPDQTIKIVLTS